MPVRPEDTAFRGPTGILAQAVGGVRVTGTLRGAAELAGVIACCADGELSEQVVELIEGDLPQVDQHVAAALELGVAPVVIEAECRGSVST